MEENTENTIDKGKHKVFRELHYGYEGNGRFTHHVGFDYISGDDALTYDALKIVNEKIQEMKQLFHDGKLSPLVYYMEKSWMDPMTLAKFVGLPVWTVKRHFKPRVFARLKPEILEKYAVAFEITVDELKNPG
jgi:hypothetical protein